MFSELFSRILILLFGILHPAYNSFKALKNRDPREQIKLLMHWIVFALFTSCEMFLDVFVSWFPFYYEIKILFVIWLISPYTRGAIIFYRKLIHPKLIQKEYQIEEFIEKIKEKGYKAFIDLFQLAYRHVSNLMFQSSSVFGQTLLTNILSPKLQQQQEKTSSKKKANENSDDYEEVEAEKPRKKKVETKKIRKSVKQKQQLETEEDDAESKSMSEENDEIEENYKSKTLKIKETKHSKNKIFENRKKKQIEENEANENLVLA